jgi:hypothetical protein
MSRIGDHYLGDHYPAVPGYTEPTTSKLAARKIQPKTEALYADILTVLRLSGARGLTPDETAAMLGKSVLLIRPRFTELGPKHFNKIEKTGDRRTNESGMSASVWRIRS